MLCLPVAAGVLTVTSLVYMPCRTSGRTPSDYGPYRWEQITIPAHSGGTFEGYLVHGTNSATVIFPPATSGDRGARLKEARVLMQRGYNVLTFDSRRCAGLGPLSLGHGEVQEVGDVLDYLRSRNDIDMDRVGIHGFSSAGATAIMAAARYPSLKAVVAEGGYADLDDLIHDYEQDMPLLVTPFRWSFRLTYRVIVGNSLDTLSPVDVIDQIGPRPVLLIYGSKESSLAGGRLQAEAATPHAELWVVPGAGHGNYIDVAPELYAERVVGFFDRALVDN
ncbi:MAG: prolyl oligopeptidase family serine peptidase [Chloroflexi bacterium]|nr:prolyl oligopeptidase family serine peptidase [Chloroflexota bacterium]